MSYSGVIFDESDSRFTIGESLIDGAGHGLFARVPIALGERLRVVGVFVRAGSVADDCTRYADAYKFRVGELLLIPVGLAALVNHSKDANLEKVIEGDEVFLRATRNIEPGEELLFCYSDYAQQRFRLR